MTVVKAGQYRYRFSIWRDVPATADDGQQVESAGLALFNRWANMLVLSGKERQIGGEETADTTHEIRMRLDSQTKGITPRDWLTDLDGVRYNITRAYTDGYERVLECVERQ